MTNNVMPFRYVTDTAFYILLSLNEPRHGCGITVSVSELTENKIRLGAGTVYGTLNKMLKDGLIDIFDDSDKRVSYEMTQAGKDILNAEISRIKQFYRYTAAREKYFAGEVQSYEN